MSMLHFAYFAFGIWLQLIYYFKEKLKYLFSVGVDTLNELTQYISLVKKIFSSVFYLWLKLAIMDNSRDCIN